MTTRTRTRTYAGPATLALLTAGCSVTDLAERVRLSRPSVSNYLLGRRPMPGHVAEAIVDLIGEDEARRVLALIPDNGGFAA